MRLKSVLRLAHGSSAGKVAVGIGHHSPYGVEVLLDALPVHGVAGLGVQSIGGSQNGVVGLCKGAGPGNLAIAVLGDHRQRALRQVAEIVGEVGIDAIDDRLVAVAAVVAEGSFAQEEVAHLIDAIAVHQIERVDHVADRLRHLLPAVVEEAVREDPMRQRDARRHQERRPIDRVESARYPCR